MDGPDCYIEIGTRDPIRNVDPSQIAQSLDENEGRALQGWQRTLQPECPPSPSSHLALRQEVWRAPDEEDGIPRYGVPLGITVAVQHIRS